MCEKCGGLMEPITMYVAPHRDDYVPTEKELTDRIFSADYPQH
jgi:hypothetical protein